jgi:hypothetical protein
MSGSCSWRCQCPPGKSALSGSHSRICVPPPPGVPHWCCNECTLPGGGELLRRCKAHPRAVPTVSTGGLWAATAGTMPPVWRPCGCSDGHQAGDCLLAALPAPDSGTALGCSTARVVAHALQQTVSVLSSPPVGHPAVVVALTLVPGAPTVAASIRRLGPALKRWAIIMPNTPAGALVPMLPHRRTSPTASTYIYNRLEAVTWATCVDTDEVLPGLTQATYATVLKSPCASERWWFCSGARVGEHVFARQTPVGGTPIRMAPPASFVLPGCPYPVSALPAAALLVDEDQAAVQCGRCHTKYPSFGAFARACAPDVGEC